MLKLLRIEYIKLRTYRAFWLITGAYILALAFLVFGIPELIDYLIEKVGPDMRLRMFKAIVFNFPDIWQNIGFVASARFFIKNILAIIIIILVTNEYSYQTIRLNVVNGLSRNDFMYSKLLLIGVFSLLSTFILFASGLYLGLSNSANKSMGEIFGRMEYLLAYFLEIFAFLPFAMLLGFLTKRAGLTMIILLLYLIIEPILDFKLPDQYDHWLPLNVMNSLIRTPNTTLIKIKTPDMSFEFQEAIRLADLARCVGYTALFIFIMFRVQRRRDL